MNILIISTNRNKYPIPVMPIGACMVAQATELAGYRVRLLDLMFCKKTEKAIEPELNIAKPDVVGISLRNIDNHDMQNPLEYISELPALTNIIGHKTDAVIVLGGAAVAIMPEELLRFSKITWGVTGSGEVVFPRLLAAISAGNNPGDIPGVASLKDGSFKKNPLPVYDSTMEYPFIDYRRWLDVEAYRSRLATVPVQSRRGCPNKCIYCTYSMSEGRNYRLCPPESVVDTIGRLVCQELRDIEFVDNVFNSPYDYALDLCNKLAEAQTGAHLHSFNLNPLFLDDDLLSAMEKADFVDIGITAENASDKVLKRLRKNFTAADLSSVAQVVRQHNIPCLWIFMLGAPGETETTVRETLDFAEQHTRSCDVAFFNVGVRIYPGSELEYIARQEGILTAPAHEMLAPVFYFSPKLDLNWLSDELNKVLGSHFNFIGHDSISQPFLPLIQYVGSFLNIKPHLWRYTRYIRSGLSLFGY